MLYYMEAFLIEELRTKNCILESAAENDFLVNIYLEKQKSYFIEYLLLNLIDAQLLIIYTMSHGFHHH